MRTDCAGLLRDWVPHCAELRGSVCNGRPINWLILRRSNSQLRPLIPPCGGSNPPAPANRFSELTEQPEFDHSKGVARNVSISAKTDLNDQRQLESLKIMPPLVELSAAQPC